MRETVVVWSLWCIVDVSGCESVSCLFRSVDHWSWTPYSSRHNKSNSRRRRREESWGDIMLFQYWAAPRSKWLFNWLYRSPQLGQNLLRSAIFQQTELNRFYDCKDRQNRQTILRIIYLWQAGPLSVSQWERLLNWACVALLPVKLTL